MSDQRRRDRPVRWFTGFPPSQHYLRLADAILIETHLSEATMALLATRTEFHHSTGRDLVRDEYGQRC